MTAVSRRARGLALATGLLAAGTVATAALLAASVDGLAGTAAALGGRVAPDWLAVAALLVLAGQSFDPPPDVTRRTVGALALVVFVGGVAVEAWPVAERLVGPASLDAASLARGIAAALRGALFPTGLFLGAVAGTTAVRDATDPGAGAMNADPDPDPGPTTDTSRSAAADGTGFPTVVARTLAPIAVAAAVGLALAVATRVAGGADHLAFVAADAGTAALSGLLTYGVLAAALVAVAVRDRAPAALGALTAAVWLGLLVASLAVALVGGALGALLATQTTTPVALVERSTLAHWPSPLSATLLLGTGTFLAGAVGLRAVGSAAGQTAVGEPSGNRSEPTESGSSTGDPGEAG